MLIRSLGDSSGVGTGGPTFDAWTAAVAAQGNGPTSAAAVTWPFAGKLYGLWAARYDVQTYGRLYNAGQIDTRATQQANATNTFVYVLAPGSVQEDSPQSQSAWQQLVAEGLAAGDYVAGAVGLPSLNSIQGFLTKAGWMAGAALALILFGPALVRSLSSHRR